MLKKPDTLAERVAWALQLIKQDREIGKGINDVDLAKKLGIDKNTLGSYRKGKGSFKSSVAEKLIEYYKFSADWLLRGAGAPFTGSEQYGRKGGLVFVESDLSSAREVPKHYEEGEDEMRGTKLSDDIALAARILESRTPYATALRLNIQAFGRAMSAEQRITQVEQRVTTSESQLLEKLNELTTRIQELETRNEELESATHPPEKPPQPPEGENPETK